MVVTYNIIQYSVPFAVVGTMGFKRSQLFPCSHPHPSSLRTWDRSEPGAPFHTIPALLHFSKEPCSEMAPAQKQMTGASLICWHRDSQTLVVSDCCRPLPSVRDRSAQPRHHALHWEHREGNVGLSASYRPLSTAYRPPAINRARFWSHCV